MEIEINAIKRDLQGTGASRRLRRAGRVPGIVYGAGKDAQAIDLDHKELYFSMKNEAFHSSVLTLNLGGAKESVLLRDFQMHPYKQFVQHVDFQRVDATQKVHVKVPLHFINADTAPGVKLSGGMVSHVCTEVEVACLPADLPEFIEVDLTPLSGDHAIYMSHLTLPAGVELSGLHGEDPVVATILLTKTEAAAAEGEGEAPAA
jgi:large subunit ribosomal protein L25